MPNRRWGRRATPSVLCALILTGVLAGCSSHGTTSRASTGSTTAPGSGATTSGPTSSTSPTDPSPRDQLIAAHKAYEAAYSACAASPGTCDVSAVVIAGSPAAAGVATYIGQLAKDGLRGRPSPGTYYVYETFSLANTGTQAVVRVCTVDADVVYKPHSGPQGEDVIVNDRVDSDRSDWTFRLDGQVWKLYVSNVISQWKGSNGCPPKPVV
jgi:hypothetical protein